MMELINKYMFFPLGLALIRHEARVDGISFADNPLGNYCTSDVYLATYLTMMGAKLNKVENRNRNVKGKIRTRWKFFFTATPGKLLDNWASGRATVDARAYAKARVALKERAEKEVCR